MPLSEQDVNDMIEDQSVGAVVARPQFGMESVGNSGDGQCGACFRATTVVVVDGLELCGRCFHVYSVHRVLDGQCCAVHSGSSDEWRTWLVKRYAGSGSSSRGSW